MENEKQLELPKTVKDATDVYLEVLKKEGFEIRATLTASENGILPRLSIFKTPEEVKEEETTDSK